MAKYAGTGEARAVREAAGSVMPKVDYVEVERKAHELEAARGQDGARRCAAKIAVEALADGETDEHAFWRAVEMSLTIR